MQKLNTEELTEDNAIHHEQYLRDIKEACVDMTFNMYMQGREEFRFQQYVEHVRRRKHPKNYEPYIKDKKEYKYGPVSGTLSGERDFIKFLYMEDWFNVPETDSEFKRQFEYYKKRMKKERAPYEYRNVEPVIDLKIFSKCMKEAKKKTYEGNYNILNFIEDLWKKISEKQLNKGNKMSNQKLNNQQIYKLDHQWEIENFKYERDVKKEWPSNMSYEQSQDLSLYDEGSNIDARF